MTCAVVGGDVYCWGANSHRILGDEDYTLKSPDPVPIAGLDDPVTGLSIGQTHACVVRGDLPACWGQGSNGQLGTGTDIELIPTQVVGLASPVQEVVAGFQHTCMLETDGDVKCWGNSGTGEATWTVPAVAVPLPSQAVRVAAGFVSCAVLEDATAYCWGHNHKGQLGVGTMVDSPSPLQVTTGEGVASISAWASHVCSVLGSGRVRCWGWNDFGQLGVETTENLGDDDLEMPPPVVNLMGTAGSLCFEGAQCLSGTCYATNECAP